MEAASAVGQAVVGAKQVPSEKLGPMNRSEVLVTSTHLPNRSPRKHYFSAFYTDMPPLAVERLKAWGEAGRFDHIEIWYNFDMNVMVGVKTQPYEFTGLLSLLIRFVDRVCNTLGIVRADEYTWLAAWWNKDDDRTGVPGIRQIALEVKERSVSDLETIKSLLFTLVCASVALIWVNLTRIGYSAHVLSFAALVAIAGIILILANIATQHKSALTAAERLTNEKEV